MPFELIWEPRGVCRRYFGAVTVAERQRSFDLICGDPRFDALRYTITDYREVVDYEISEEALTWLIDRTEHLHSLVRTVCEERLESLEQIAREER